MKKSLLLSLALVIVLLASVGMAPASTASAAKPQIFNADFAVGPLFDTVNVQHGDSDRWRTINEHYAGGIWGDINGSVFMSITTNFVETDSGAFSGPFHSTIDINNGDGTISLNVTGKIEGFKAPGWGIVFASITGKFNSTGGTGSLAGKHLNGDLDYLIDVTGYPIIVSEGTLSGTIH